MLAHNINLGKRTKDVQISQNITFDAMFLSPKTLEGLQTSGFHKPSPIQLQAIPLGKCGFDLMLEAKSGTGKTIVFTVIALEKLDLTKGLQTIILTPTREIAAQIGDVIKKIGAKNQALVVEFVIGGFPLKEDVAKLKEKTVHIIVGSPGRLRHLISDKHIDTSAVRLLVIDEADKLMEKSFKNDINYIFKALPNQKQVIMSSATYSDTSRVFINQYMQSVQHICPDSNNILLGIEQKVAIVKYSNNIVVQTQSRFQELLSILSEKQFKQCLIFCNYQARVAELYKLLKQSKWPAEQLYGQQDQIDRLDALNTLKAYKCRILVSTDLAARGIDASNVDLVINFEPPFEWQTYLHRIGRAGRYGTLGVAVTLLSEGNEQKKFKEMLVSMKDSLHITHFWNDNKFVLHNNDLSNPKSSSPEPDVEVELNYLQLDNKKITHNNNYKELWKELTDQRKIEMESIENFETLNKSWKTTHEVVIESFPHLLQSFQNNQCDSEDIDCSYQCIKMPEISLKKYSVQQMKIMGYNFDELLFKKSVICEKFNNVSQPSKNVTDEEHNTDSYIYDSNKMEIEKSVIYTAHEDVNIETENKIDLVPVSENRVNIINTSGEKPMYENNSQEGSIKSNVDEKALLYEDVSDVLEAVGLPTSFHSSKHSNPAFKYPQVNKQTGSIKKYSKSEISKQIGEENKNKELFLEYQQISFANSETKGNIIKSKKHSENVPYKHTNLASVNINEERMKKYIYDSEIRQNSETDESNDNIICQTKNYYSWYNQLKFTMKQIELAIYIDEMSQIC